MSLAKIYGALVVNDQTPLPGDLQLAIATWCTSRPGRDQILADLVRRTDLDPRVDTIASDIENAKVKGAWLSRPGRSPEELVKLVAQEKRASVLIAVAESDNISSELLDAMAQDERVTVAEAVIRAPKASDAAILRVLPRVLGHPRNHSVARDAGRALAARPHLHNAIAKKANAEAGIHLVSSPGLDADAIAHLFDVLVNQPLERSLNSIVADPARLGTDRSYYRSPLINGMSNSIRRTAALVDQPACRLEHVEKAANLYASIFEAAGEHSDKLPSMPPEVLVWFSAARGDDDSRTHIEAERTRRADMLHLAATATDADVLRPLVSLALQKNQTEIHDAVRSNPSLTASMFPTEFGYHDKVDAFLFPLFRQSPDPAADADLVRLGTHVLSHASIPEGVLATLYETDPAFAKAVLASSADNIAAWRLTRLMSDARFADTVTTNLGMNALASLLEVDPSVAAAVVPLLVERFGNDAAAWEIFHSLADDFTGSVSGLVDAATALVD